MPSETVVCPVSEYREAIELESGGDYRRIQSPPLDMVYRISGSADAIIEHLSSSEAARLATWLIDQHRLGVNEPLINSDVLDLATHGQALPIEARIERFFRYLKLHIHHLGEMIKWRTPGFEPISRTEKDRLNSLGAQLWAECINDQELQQIEDYAVQTGRMVLGAYRGSVGLTIAGWQYLETLSSRDSSSDQAFIAMWFGDDVADAYHNGIAPAVKETGYVPMRIDQKEHSNRIDDEIIAEIRRSKFLIADFTCGVVMNAQREVAIPRGGVYYEAGFAQGLGIPVIWMCREDHINHVHFDTRQFNHITWKDAADLREKLKNRIGAVLGDGPNISR